MKFIILYDDNFGLCAPYGWCPECLGAVEAIGQKQAVATFATRADAQKALRISRLWNQILKARSEPHNDDFEGEYSKHIRIVPLAEGGAA